MIRVTPPGKAFTDERGKIEDLLVTPLDAVTRIFTKKGAVRGNHYHVHTTQFTLVLKGQLLVLTRMRFGDPKTVQEDYLSVGEMMCSPPDELHAWRALVDTDVLVFTNGPRSGPEFESDVVRLGPGDRLIES